MDNRYFKKVSEVGVQCLRCDCLMPMVDAPDHKCDAEALLRKATLGLEIKSRELKQEDKMGEEIVVKKILMSDSLNELATALSKAQALMEPATKDQSNPFFKSNYADLASVWKACRGPLSANGLSVTQLASTDGPKVTIITMLLHSSGQYISSELSMQADKITPQGIGSAITYARRYALSAIVGISAEDDDGNSASGLKVEKKGLSSETTAKLEKTRKLLVDEKFFMVLGNEGYTQISEVNNEAVAKQMLVDLQEVYNAGKESK
jgi:hypothetical protein